MKKKQLLLTACMLAIASSSAWASNEKPKTVDGREIFVCTLLEYKGTLTSLAAG